MDSILWIRWQCFQVEQVLLGQYWSLPPKRTQKGPKILSEKIEKRRGSKTSNRCLFIWKKKIRGSNNEARTPLIAATAPPPPLAYFGNVSYFPTKKKICRERRQICVHFYSRCDNIFNQLPLSVQWILFTTLFQCFMFQIETMEDTEKGECMYS